MWQYNYAPFSDELYHHGIRGQKWGKKNGPPYPLDASDHSSSEKKAGWRKSLDTASKVVKAAKKSSGQTMKDGYDDSVSKRLKKDTNGGINGNEETRRTAEKWGLGRKSATSSEKAQAKAEKAQAKEAAKAEKKYIKEEIKYAKKNGGFDTYVKSDGEHLQVDAMYDSKGNKMGKETVEKVLSTYRRSESIKGGVALAAMTAGGTVVMGILAKYDQ